MHVSCMMSVSQIKQTMYDLLHPWDLPTSIIQISVRPVSFRICQSGPIKTSRPAQPQNHSAHMVTDVDTVPTAPS